MTSMFDGIFDRVALSATNENQLKKVEIQFRAQKYRQQILVVWYGTVAINELLCMKNSGTQIPIDYS